MPTAQTPEVAQATWRMGEPARRPSLAGDLAARQPPIEAVTSNDEVLAYLAAHREAEMLAVVEGGSPIGLINRNVFMEAYAKPYSREVFGRRSCIAWMDRFPLVVDCGLPLEALAQRAVDAGAKSLQDGFIVTEAGRYAGLGTGHALLKALAELEAEKTLRLHQSIDYASTIQRSFLRASDEHLAAALPEHALVWEPRDVVGGDCYFVRCLEAGTFLALLDCTGHGVPGAFMTLIALSWLEQAFQGPGAPPEPAAALAGLNRHIKRVLGQEVEGKRGEEASSRSDDGLDGACLWLPAGQPHLEFAGARLPLLVMRPGDAPVELVAGDRASVGYLDTPTDRRWTTSRVAVPGGTLLALATDGVTDQVGGPKRVAFGRARLAQVLAEGRAAPAPAVAGQVRQALQAWQGAERRRDDLALLLLRAGARP